MTCLRPLLFLVALCLACVPAAHASTSDATRPCVERAAAPAERGEASDAAAEQSLAPCSIAPAIFADGGARHMLGASDGHEQRASRPLRSTNLESLKRPPRALPRML